jgi:hypothetical protein
MKKLLTILAIAVFLSAACTGLQTAKTYQVGEGWQCLEHTYSIKIPSEMPAGWVTDAPVGVVPVGPYLIMGVFRISDEESVGVILDGVTDACPGFVALIWARETIDSSTIRFFVYDGDIPVEVTEAQLNAVVMGFTPPDVRTET